MLRESLSPLAVFLVLLSGLFCVLIAQFAWNPSNTGENFPQTAAYLSVMLFSILSVGTLMTKRATLQRRWQKWQKPPTIGRQELLAFIRQEVTERSQQSLHRAVINTLMFDKHPEEDIPRLWDVELKIGQRPSRKLHATEKILDNFPDRGNLGRVLILGMQGSGKTSTLLELAADLCDRALDDSHLPIPILLDLPNWRSTQPLSTWIECEIHNKYGVSFELSETWLQSGQLLLLLDGLDRLDSSAQESCVAALNKFKLSDGRSLSFFVSTRMTCYKQTRNRLRFSAAIGLKQLKSEQIQNYLIASRSRELWENIKDHPDSLAVAKTPLFLNLMTLAHEEILIHSWKRLQSKEERIEYLFNAYIRSQMGRNMSSQWYRAGKKPTPEQIKHWLKWLATTMTEQQNTEFSLDKLPYPPLQYSGHFICLGIVLILVGIYTVLFVKFYTINIGLTYAIFFIASAWGFITLLALKTRHFKIKTFAPRILWISALRTILLFSVGLLSFQLNDLLIHQTNTQTGSLLYGSSLLIFLVAIAPVLGLIASIYSALPWMKHLSLRITLWRNGDIPWNFGQFLGFLTERLLMQKVLQRYRFIHPLLVQHFYK